jgi:hypothetical protein
LTKGRTSYDLERRIARIFRVVWSSGGLPAVGHRRAGLMAPRSPPKSSLEGALAWIAET